MENLLTALPLGGLGEIGMNGLVISYQGRRLLVDCGVMFPDAMEASVDVVLPDLAFFDKHAESFGAMVLTHGHEDHIGAVPFVLRRAAMPIYASPFTLGLVERRLKEHGLLSRADLRVLEPSMRSDGPVVPPELPDFGLSFIRVTHSIPDAASLVIHTPKGVVFHTGDFKIDPEPMDDEHFDNEAFRDLGDQGVLLMLSDSTNAQVPGHTRSERETLKNIEDKITDWHGRVFITQFASNLHRLRGMEAIAERTGRRLCLVGRSLHSYTKVARDAHIPSIDPKRLVDIEHLHKLADNEVLVVMTGSQGEFRAALSWASRGEHRYIQFKKGDRILMSARFIPGNEAHIFDLVNNLSRLGTDVIHPLMAPIHTSGHARQDELRTMLELVRPQMFVPVHGTHAFLKAHRALAEDTGVHDTLLVENGHEFAADSDRGLFVVDEHPMDTCYFDGVHTGDADTLGLVDRKKLFFNGVVSAVVTLRGGGKAFRPLVQLQARGLFTDNDRLLTAAAAFVTEELIQLGPDRPPGEMEDWTSRLVRRYFRRKSERKPLVMVTVIKDKNP